MITELVIETKPRGKTNMNKTFVFSNSNNPFKPARKSPSKPEELPLELLPEPYVKLSLHTALLKGPFERGSRDR